MSFISPWILSLNYKAFKSPRLPLKQAAPVSLICCTVQAGILCSSAADGEHLVAVTVGF